MRRATRLMRSASATDEPPNFMHDEGGGHGRILAEDPVPPAGRSRPERAGPPRPTDPARDNPRPAPTIARRTNGSRVDVLRPRLPAADPAHRRRRAGRAGRRRSTPPTATGSPPTGRGRPSRRGRDRHPARRPRAPRLLPRARAAVRRARRRRHRDRLLRPDCRHRRARAAGSTTCPHVPLTTYDGLRADIDRRGRAPARRGPRRRALFTVGFCMGGRLAFLSAEVRARARGRHRLLRLAGRAVAQRHARRRPRSRHVRVPGPGDLRRGGRGHRPAPVGDVRGGPGRGRRRAPTSSTYTARRTASSIARRTSSPEASAAAWERGARLHPGRTAG